MDAHITAAIELLRNAGYRVTKPAPTKTKAQKTLNAIGKPYSPLYDPRYRTKYKTPRTPYGESTAANHATASYLYKACMQRRHADDPALLADILARNGVR